MTMWVKCVLVHWCNASACSNLAQGHAYHWHLCGLQEKKQLVFEGTVGKDAEALGRLTEDDLRFLFG